MAATQRKSLEHRFGEKIVHDPDTDCIVWVGGATSDGYGLIYVDGTLVYVHRLSVEWSGRSIPDGMQVDHLCNNPPCVGESHLKVVTPRENVLRSSSPTALNLRKTHCPMGHDYSGGNLRLTATGGRVCRACHSERESARGRRKRAEQRLANA